MNLLEKFEKVELKEEDRISETDQALCEAHQQAYENARNSLPEFIFIGKDMRDTQKELLAGTGAGDTTYLPEYVSEIDDQTLRKHLVGLPHTFIRQIVSYFNSTYCIGLSCGDVITALLPQEPEHTYEEGFAERYRQYEEDMLQLSIHYRDILRLLFLQTEGRDFHSQALYELKSKCHDAAWNSDQGCARYERARNILRFQHSACHYTQYGPPFSLSTDLRNILQGIAHLETGSFNTYPYGFADLFRSTYYNEHDFPGCHKVEQLKMFKNGRVDIRFSSEASAREFVDEYLGTVC